MNDGRTTISERVPVRFAGGRDRTGPATVGQVNMRRVVLRDEPEQTNVCLIWKAPPESTVEHLADLIRVLVLRHEALRTTFPVDPELRQSVAADGELSMAVYEAGDEVVAGTEEVSRRLCADRFDPATELPVRVAAITEHGVPAYVTVAVCHVAVDTTSLELLRREWADLAAGRELPAPSAVQPVDLAEMEQTPTGQRRSRSSLQYWEDVLRSMPQAMFAAPGVGRTDWMLPHLTIRSRAAGPALARIADRTGVSRGTVVLAGLCALLGYRLGMSRCVVAMLASNRYLPYLTDHLGTLSQDALMSADLRAATFDELIKHVGDRSLAAHRRSWFDSEALWKIIDEVSAQRGTHWARDCVFNDLTTLTRRGLASLPPDNSDPGDPANDIRLTWEPAQPVPTRLMFWAMRMDDEVELSMRADPQCLPTVDAESFGGAILRLIIQAADHDVSLDKLEAVAGFQPVERGAGWYRIDSCWVELAAVRELLAGVLGDRPQLVVPVPDEELGHRLECYVAVGRKSTASTASTESLSAQRFHADCVAALDMRPNAMAPHRYVLCAQAPNDPGDVDAWRAQAIVADSSGRTQQVPAETVAR